MNAEGFLNAIRYSMPRIIKDTVLTNNYITFNGTSFTTKLNGKVTKGTIAEALITIHGDVMLALEANDAIIHMRIHWVSDRVEVYCNGTLVMSDGEFAVKDFNNKD